jgi:hypothetical protein
MFIGPNIVTDGLVFSIDVGSKKSYPGSGTAIYDLSGNGNNATLTNGPLVTNSVNGGSVQADGSNDYISVSNMPTGTSWTIQTWTFIDGPTTFSVTGHRTYACTDYFRFQWDDKNTNIAYAPFVDFSSAAGSANITGFTNKSEDDVFNKWNQVTMTSDGTTISLYWNDVKGTSSSITRNFSSNGNMQIGYNGLSGIGGTDIFNRDGGNCYFGPTMVYNRGLSQSEVLQNYNAAKPRFI